MQHPYSSYTFNIHSPFSFLQTGRSGHDTCPTVTEEKPGNYHLLLQMEHTLELHTGDLRLSVSPGEYLLLPSSLWNARDTETENADNPEEECRFRWLRFSCPQNPSSDSPVSGNRKNQIFLSCHGALMRPQKVLLLMRQLQDCVHSGYEKHYLDYLTTLVLCEIFHQQCLMNGKKAGLPELPDAKRKLYIEILDYINECITSNLKVNAIARHFGYNEKYLSRYFKEISGISMKQYIMNQKIEYADFLLSDTKLTINEIARELGFSDYHNFIRVYKSITAMTPTEYRRIYLGSTSAGRTGL